LDKGFPKDVASLRSNLHPEEGEVPATETRIVRVTGRIRAQEANLQWLALRSCGPAVLGLWGDDLVNWGLG